MSESSTAPRTKARDRSATEQRIVAAVGEVLSRDGFVGIGVNAIAKQAGVDKVLIYRYFGGLDQLLAVYGHSGEFWPSVNHLLGEDPQAFLRLSASERYVRFFEHFIDELRVRPLTLEILAQEVIERNELTAILESARERWGEEAERVIGGESFAKARGVRGMTLLLIAGIQYMLVRSRKIRTFGGIDLRSDEGWAAMKSSIRAFAENSLPEATET